jgi:hypothetical protein
VDCPSPGIYGLPSSPWLDFRTSLRKVHINPHMCLQYVDDLLLSGDNQEEVMNTTISFINFLGSHGLHISKNKLQFAETEVKYL